MFVLFLAVSRLSRLFHGWMLVTVLNYVLYVFCFFIININHHVCVSVCVRARARVCVCACVLFIYLFTCWSIIIPCTVAAVWYDNIFGYTPLSSWFATKLVVSYNGTGCRHALGGKCRLKSWSRLSNTNFGSKSEQTDSFSPEVKMSIHCSKVAS